MNSVSRQHIGTSLGPDVLVGRACRLYYLTGGGYAVRVRLAAAPDAGCFGWYSSQRLDATQQPFRAARRACREVTIMEAHRGSDGTGARERRRSRG